MSLFTNLQYHQLDCTKAEPSFRNNSALCIFEIDILISNVIGGPGTLKNVKEKLSFEKKCDSPEKNSALRLSSDYNYIPLKLAFGTHTQMSEEGFLQIVVEFHEMTVRILYIHICILYPNEPS